MKILHCLAQKPGCTGSGVYLNSIVNEATKKNYQQAVICGIQKDDTTDFPDNVTVYPVFFGTKELPFPVVGMSNVMPYESTRYCDLTSDMLDRWKTAFGKKLETAVNEFKPDIILSHHLWILSVFVKEKFPQIPLLAIAHGTGLRQLEFCENLRDYVLTGCQNIDRVLCLNQLQKKVIQQKFHLKKDNLIVTGTGYNSDLFYLKPRLERQTVRIVYAGKLCKTKGVFSLLNAIQNIKIENVMFDLIGGASKENALALMEKSTDSFHSILFTGTLPQADVAKIFQNGDIFVLPSFYEGFPLVLIEAIACGMNIVVTDLPGFREILGKEYSESPYITFVPRPRMKSVDEPYDYDVEKFEAALKTAIETQIFQVTENTIAPRQLIENTVKKWTWAKLFTRLEKQMKALI
jgi:glycosyltransferase involved in cell wall biosynthesis